MNASTQPAEGAGGSRSKAAGELTLGLEWLKATAGELTLGLEWLKATAGELTLGLEWLKAAALVWRCSFAF
jgi:hypothetical protein